MFSIFLSSDLHVSVQQTIRLCTLTLSFPAALSSLYSIRRICFSYDPKRHSAFFCQDFKFISTRFSFQKPFHITDKEILRSVMSRIDHRKLLSHSIQSLVVSDVAGHKHIRAF